ncbi:hypothetical protein H0E87_015657 [Populus deltoides]|uniref:MORN repeat-containing protein n=1 Tax=Populus deltoides TaxID=3696 RepID=A0A8T2Y5Z9_POPDE|nr:hypothetical protein H0E87_015657 [Populus deltoides]
MNLKNFSSSSFFLGAERDSLKKWIPTMEMQYRGAVYREWCQGGLPEGKVHLILEDGRMYDGMWCYGKRSCPGTFYFNHGDVFQGSWRDDVIHGKEVTLERGNISTCACVWWACASGGGGGGGGGEGLCTGLDGLQTFGRERPVEKVASIQSLVMSVLAISKMVGDMITSFELILMEQDLVTWFRVISAGISREMANS